MIAIISILNSFLLSLYIVCWIVISIFSLDHLHSPTESMTTHNTSFLNFFFPSFGKKKEVNVLVLRPNISESKFNAASRYFVYIFIAKLAKGNNWIFHLLKLSYSLFNMAQKINQCCNIWLDSKVPMNQYIYLFF